MISIKDIDSGTILGEGSGFISAKECNELSDIRYTERLLINDGKNAIFIGELNKVTKKEYREYRPRLIIQASSESDQVFLQSKVDGTDDALLIFWSPEEQGDPEIKDKTSKIRGGYRIAGGLTPHFTDNSRSTMTYVNKTHRIHHIPDNEEICFFVADYHEQPSEEELA